MHEREQRYEANKIVLALVGQDESLAQKWWETYNRRFCMSPEEAWKIDHEWVLTYLYTHDSYF